MASGEKLKKKVAISGARRLPENVRVISNRKNTLARCSSSIRRRPLFTGLPNVSKWRGNQHPPPPRTGPPPGPLALTNGLGGRPPPPPPHPPPSHPSARSGSRALGARWGESACSALARSRLE